MPDSITEFRITFYNQDGKFHEGNTLSGSVKFVVQNTIAISRECHQVHIFDLILGLNYELATIERFEQFIESRTR